MVGASNPLSNSALDGQSIARIVGFTCMIGFIVDMTALTFPLGSGASWRAGLLQQMGDRSIVLLIGLALVIYSFWNSPQLRKLIAYISLSIGALFLLFCVLVVRDSFALHNQAVNNITQQAAELQTQIEESRNNPEIAAQASPEDFEQAALQISTQAENLTRNAKTALTKTGIASTSNFAIVGAGLITLGRLALPSSSGPKPQRNKPKAKSKRKR
ncbi:hypothetical protein C7271_09390 [filamentous cyanobacterium CCP5]|nr:hypothetical protein C7271_09390 [filamentous cyanobacterium CCP5]